MTGPSSVKSSTDDDDDNEISLIFVLPVMDIELSRAVPRVNKNLKKKEKARTWLWCNSFSTRFF